jgi:UDP-3-O-[3-hydroxymyristoyl] glucosamine N-acyltransferase
LQRGVRDHEPEVRVSRFTVRELAERVNGRVEGDPTATVTGVAPIHEAGPGDLTFVAGPRYERALAASHPTAVLVPDGFAADGHASVTLIHVGDPHLALGRLLPLFFPESAGADAGGDIHPTAILGGDVCLGDGVVVGPYAVLEPGCSIGPRTTIAAHVHVGSGAVIGEGCVLGSGCSILGAVRMGDRVRVHTGARVGTEGYGFSDDGGRPVKIPQVGRCIIGDDVEIGANSTIDRGALGDTVVGAGTKIDNLVHIGHNVRIGENCMIVAQVGIAGSVEIGDGVQLAGQAGIAGHLSIGDGARVAAQAGVIGDVPAGATYSGYPARPHGHAMRASAALFRLPDLLKRVRRLERSTATSDAEAPEEA